MLKEKESVLCGCAGGVAVLGTVGGLGGVGLYWVEGLGVVGLYWGGWGLRLWPPVVIATCIVYSTTT